jgi:hypothetical protein
MINEEGDYYEGDYTEDDGSESLSNPINSRGSHMYEDEEDFVGAKYRKD